MQQGVSLEVILYPEVGVDIILGRFLACAMNNLKDILAFACQRLWQQRDVAILDVRECSRIVDHLLHLLAEFCSRGGQSADVVALRAEVRQHVIERLRHIHAAGREVALARSLEVDDGQTLIAVILVLKVHDHIDGLDKFLQTVGNGVGMQQSIGIPAQAKHRRGADGSVNLRHDHTLRHKAAHHAHRVLLPLLHLHIDVQRVEQWNVSFRQKLHHIVAQSAVGYVDDGIGLNLLGKIEQMKERRDRIDVVPARHQRFNQLCRVGDKSCHQNLLATFKPKALPAHELLVVADTEELVLILTRRGIGQRIVQIVLRLLLRQRYLASIDDLTIHISAQEVQQTAKVFFRRAHHIFSQQG